MAVTKGLHLEDIIEKIRAYKPDADVQQILGTYTFASSAHGGQTRLSGEPYMSHPMEVANILTSFKMDTPVIAAGLLHDTLEDTDVTAEELERRFGKEITSLVEGLTKIGKIRFSSKEERQAENVRKMILAMSDDIRVVIIKLADRLHNMRTLKHLSPDRKKAIAQETMDIYAPLANRLGIHWLKVELEDLAFMYIYPEEYKKVTELVRHRSGEIDNMVISIGNQAREMLMKERIPAEVTARPKHAYSIYKKMKSQNLEFEQLHDIVGIRIITNELLDCYKVLGLLHTKWKPIPGKFKDYIALPKENMYQSIHTSVLTGVGRLVEFQIRTQQMHRTGEEGIAAHWRYKEGGQASRQDGEHFIWLRRLLEMGQSIDNSEEFLENVKQDLFPDEVYVFTPEQEVKAFPPGATPIDFAYGVHSQVGHHCAGALVNGTSVPLDMPLQNGDIVEIITSEAVLPKREWLKYATTSHAKSMIRNSIRAREKAEACQLGREIVREELKKYDLEPERFFTAEALQGAAQALGLKNPEIILQKVGFSTLPVYHLLSKLLPPEEWERVESASKTSLMKSLFTLIRPKTVSTVGVRVGNPDNMLIRFAGCCNPVPGDSIMGFVSRGHGLVIHNRSCPTLKEIGPEPERLIEAQWEKPKKVQLRPVRIIAYSLNQPGILARVSAAVAECKVNIANAAARATHAKGGEIDLTVEIEDLDQLEEVMEAVTNVDGVKGVKRIMDGTHKPAKK